MRGGKKCVGCGNARGEHAGEKHAAGSKKQKAGAGRRRIFCEEEPGDENIGKEKARGMGTEKERAAGAAERGGTLDKCGFSCIIKEDSLITEVLHVSLFARGKNGDNPETKTGGGEMTRLEAARAEIDEIDREMRGLFVRRMAAVREISEEKAAAGLPVFSAEREREVTEKNLAGLSAPELAAFYEAFLRAVMEISREYQNALRGAGKTEGERT